MQKIKTQKKNAKRKYTTVLFKTDECGFGRNNHRCGLWPQGTNDDTTRVHGFFPNTTATQAP